MESIEYSWKWVTADELLSHGPCELVYALFIASGGGTATTTLFNGEDNTGETIVAFRSAQSTQSVFKPPKPIYCQSGLYVDVIAIPKGVFVQWREIGKKG